MLKRWIEEWLAERREQRVVMAEIAAGRPWHRILLDSRARFMARKPDHPANQEILALAEVYARLYSGERPYDA